MFGDIDSALNTSRGLSATAEFLVFTLQPLSVELRTDLLNDCSTNE